jgi:hypothetical protein
MVDPYADFWPFWIIILMLVHIRALFAADEFFQRRLGVYHKPISAQGRGRSVLVSAFESVMPGSQNRFRVQVDDLPNSFRVDETIIPSEVVNEFLVRSWSRQNGGKSGLSRNYWTSKRRPPIDRLQYDAIILLLLESDLINGRRQGAAGKLIYPPKIAEAQLRKHLN